MLAAGRAGISLFLSVFSCFSLPFALVSGSGFFLVRIVPFEPLLAAEWLFEL
jgi:hypothetical protein